MDIDQNNELSWIITDEVTCRRKVGNVVQESTIIDQIFCEFQINQPLGESDHVSIVIDLNLFQPDKKHCYDVDDIKARGGGGKHHFFSFHIICDRAAEYKQVEKKRIKIRLWSVHS